MASTPASQGGYETYDLEVWSGSLAAADLNLSGLAGAVYAGANTAVHQRERFGDRRIRPGQNLLTVGAGWSFSIAGVSEAHGPTVRLNRHSFSLD